MQKKANIYAPLEGNNEGWIVEIIDDRDKPFLRGKVCDGEILGWRYA